jgi:drug/metabolite transporter (DMT)-like permease
MTLPGRRLRADVVLLLAALLWGSAFVPQRLAAPHLGFFLFNGLRFLLGALILLPWVRPRRRPAKRFFYWASIAGTLLVGAAACQQAGLRYTTAGNAGFLTGLYVVLVPVVLLVVWRQKMAWRSWAGALVAAAGVFLLSADDRLRLGFGDALELIGAVLWALHVVIIGRAVTQVEVLLFSVGQYLVAGALNVVLGLALEAHTLPGLASCWWAVVYVGLFSVAAGYTLQAVGQKHAPAADAAIILSMEAVFAALFGHLLLGESLAARQLAGCVMILGAIAIVQKHGARDPARQ